MRKTKQQKKLLNKRTFVAKSQWVAHSLTHAQPHNSRKTVITTTLLPKTSAFSLVFWLFTWQQQRAATCKCCTYGQAGSRRTHDTLGRAIVVNLHTTLGWQANSMVVRLAGWLTVLWWVGACCWGRRLVVSYGVNVLNRSAAYNQCNNNKKKQLHQQHSNVVIGVKCFFTLRFMAFGQTVKLLFYYYDTVLALLRFLLLVCCV